MWQYAISGIVGLSLVLFISVRHAGKQKTQDDSELRLQHDKEIRITNQNENINENNNDNNNKKPVSIANYQLKKKINPTMLLATSPLSKNEPTSLIDQPIQLFKQCFETTLKEAQDSSTRPVCVLVLDGGGLRGVLECEILKELENKLRQISGKSDMKIGDAFDLIMGTSTGGLLSIGLGRLNWNVDQCVQLYYKMGQKVFGGREHENHNWLDSMYDYSLKFWHSSKSVLSSLTRGTVSMYSSKIFRQTLLTEIAVDEKEPLYVNKKDYITQRKPLVATVSTEVNWPQASFPAILRSYSLIEQNITKTPLFPGASTSTIIDAAMATSAAPSYFDPVYLNVTDVDGKVVKHKLVDGGLNANDPVMIAFCESKVIWPNRKIFLLSLGTGQIEIDLSNPPKGGFNVIKDLITSSFSSLFSAKESTNSLTISVLGFLNILDCIRLNPKIDGKKTAMDDPSLLKYWRQVAHDYAQKDDVNHLLHDIAAITLQCQQFDILKEARI